MSNAHIKITLKDGTESDTRDSFSCQDIGDSERQKIASKIKLECGLADDPPLDELLNFEVSDLSLSDHSGHTLQQFLDFLNRHP